jgi:hypothetical protein
VDLRRPFRHADAIANGALTRHHVVDGSFRPLFTGVSVRIEVTVTLALRAAGAVLAYPGAVVAGRAAAAMWDVDTASADTTVDLMIGPSELRARPGVRLHRSWPSEDEVAVVDGLRVTSPARTAFDLARELGREDAIVVLDALLCATGIDRVAVQAVADRRRCERGVSAVGPVLEWVDARSPSPRASRLRVGLLARGLAVPVIGQRLLDGEGRLVANLALAWPDVRTGLAHEYGARGAAGRVGWEVLEMRDDVAEEWGTRTRPAPVDGLARLLLRAADRWDPPPRLGGRRPGKLPAPPGPGGDCDGGLSRLVPA